MRTGFTLLELLIVIALIGILGALFVPEVGNLRARAEKIVCVGHLRSLHVSLGAYLNDNEQWPQCPDELEGTAADQFWIDELKDYGAPENVWHCPTLMRYFGSSMSSSNSDAQRIHYTPAQFDDNPMTPRKWAAQPWLIELSDAHSGGNLLIRADGAVQNASEAYKSDT